MEFFNISIRSLLLLFPLISACSYNNVLEVDSGTSFLGIEDYYRSGVKQVNVITVHGMGYHNGDIDNLPETGSTWKFQQLIAERLGFNIRNSQLEKVHLNLLDSDIHGGSLFHRALSKSDGEQLNYFSLSWDEITVDIQRHLLELDSKFYEVQNGEDRERKRAKINKLLKRFINRSFSDPILYLGNFGQEIRNLIFQGFQEIDRRAFTKETDSSNTVNIIVADSLGSSIVFDSVREARSRIELNKNDTFAIDSINTTIRLTDLLILHANQLPLISLGKIRGPGANLNKESWLGSYPCSKDSNNGSILEFASARAEANALYNKMEAKSSINPLQVIAFTDPNDPLSYFLTRRFRNKCTGEDLVISNVLISNAKWNYFFVFANPAKAHSSGFKRNKRAIEMIVHGYPD